MVKSKKAGRGKEAATPLLSEGLDPASAQQEFRRLLEQGSTYWDTGPKSHFLLEAAKDGLEVQDCVNVVRAGFVKPAEFHIHTQEWRYTVETARIAVVVTIDDGTLVFVTTWRISR